MSTESPNKTPGANSKSAPQSMKSSMAAEHATKPKIALQSTEAHACCHTASPAAATGTHVAERKSGAQAGAHSCTEHKTGDVVQPLVNELKSPEAAKRVAAVVALGKSADCAAAAPLIGALGDHDADVAREAATSLGVLGDASAVEPLIAVLQNADGYFHPVVRAAATISLGQLHDLRAFEPLARAINDPDAQASAEAIRSVAMLGDPRGVAALLGVIRNVHGYFLPPARRAAILGLAKLGGEIAECEVRFVSGNRWEDAVVREAAAGAVRSVSVH